MEQTYRLTSPETKCKVSSVLNKLGIYSGKNMFDESLDTCWNSDQGSPQYVLIDFQRAVKVTAIRAIFQGGFVGQNATVSLGEDMISLVEISKLEYIEDTNELQIFPIESMVCGRYFKINFNSSTDFYGRITIYNLEVIGLFI
jgi:hypothetical protein